MRLTMDSINYLTARLERLEQSVRECEQSVNVCGEEIKNGWFLIKLKDNHPYLIARYAVTKSQCQRTHCS